MPLPVLLAESQGLNLPAAASASRAGGEMAEIERSDRSSPVPLGLVLVLERKIPLSLHTTAFSLSPRAYRLGTGRMEITESQANSSISPLHPVGAPSLFLGQKCHTALGELQCALCWGAASASRLTWLISGSLRGLSAATDFRVFGSCSIHSVQKAQWQSAGGKGGVYSILPRTKPSLSFYLNWQNLFITSITAVKL
jgi:hypothetical protein